MRKAQTSASLHKRGSACQLGCARYVNGPLQDGRHFSGPLSEKVTTSAPWSPLHSIPFTMSESKAILFESKTLATGSLQPGHPLARWLRPSSVVRGCRCYTSYEGAVPEILVGRRAPVHEVSLGSQLGAYVRVLPGDAGV